MRYDSPYFFSSNVLISNSEISNWRHINQRRKLTSWYLSLCIIKGQLSEDEKIVELMGQEMICINLFTVSFGNQQKENFMSINGSISIFLSESENAFILNACQSLLNIISFHFTFQLDVNKYLLNIQQLLFSKCPHYSIFS